MEQNTNRLLWAASLLALGALLIGGGIVLAQENFLPKISQAFVKMIDEEGPGDSTEKINDLIKQGYIPVATAGELNNVRSATLETYGEGTKWEGKYTGGLDKKYVQVKDIDLSEYGDWTPIGDDYSSIFRGSFNGNRYKITGLTINRPSQDYVGLFGYTEGSTISNVALEDINVTGKSYVGGLVGEAYSETTISNSYAKGLVTGKNTEWGASYTGGLVGYAYSGTISNSYATVNVTGTGDSVGGLVGDANSSDGTSVISNSYATGSVEGRNSVGGLSGRSYSGTISNSYATGSVTGSGGGVNVGGLVGETRFITIENSYAKGEVTGTGEYTRNVGGLVGDAYSETTISNSYATGSVTGTKERVGGLAGRSESSNISNSSATGSVTGISEVGGLVGFAYAGTISNSYAKGSVSGSEKVGGFVGEAYDGTKISNSYATGSVTGTKYVGGFLGKATEAGWTGDFIVAVTNSYWDKVTTGQTTSAKQNASFGKTTDEMKSKDTYSGWAFDTVWEITPENYPTLR